MKRLVSIFLVIAVCYFHPVGQAAANTIEVEGEGGSKGKAFTEKAELRSNESIRERILELLPPAEKGYAWALHKGVALQRPVEWHEHIGGGTYCSSVESVPENGIYTTGVSIQVMRGVSKVFNITPKMMMAQYVVDLYRDQANTKILASPGGHGDIESLVYRYRNAPENLEPIIVHKYFQVSEKDDFMNIVTFETTEEHWEQYWSDIGKTILGKVMVVPYF